MKDKSYANFFLGGGGGRKKGALWEMWKRCIERFTHVTSMQIYGNERKRWHKEIVQLP